MSEANNGSAALAGNPAGNDAAGNAAANANAATPPAGTPPASGTWYDGIQDQELKGYVQNKGWKDPAELAHGYKNLEKLLGGEKLPLPKGAEDKEGWDRVYDSLGRPKSAEEYKLPVPQGDDGQFAKTASSWMHEAGLNQKQAEMLAAKWNEYSGQMQGNVQQQSAQQTEADMASLKQEWGKAYDENINFGQRAAREYGLDGETLAKMENAMGTKGLLEFMAKIGRSQGEASFVEGGGRASFGMTPAAAQERINALRNDQAWATKYLNGDVEAQAEMKRLTSLAYPES